MERRQARRYREIIGLLGVVNESEFMARLRARKGAASKEVPSVWEPEPDGRLWQTPRDKNDRIRRVARENPELSIPELVERFGGSRKAIEKLLSRAKIRRVAS